MRMLTTEEWDALHKKMQDMIDVLKECDDYLSKSPKEAIGSGSQLHQAIKRSLS